MRDGGGSSWAPIDGNKYDIKTMAVTPASASGMSASEIEGLFQGLDPSAVAEAGSAHTTASETLSTIAESLISHAQVLQANWGGAAAQASISAFQQLHTTAAGLSQAAAQTGSTLSWLGGTILPFYKAYKAPSNGILGDIESAFGDNPSDKAAQQVMERLNNRLTQANAGLPPSVSQSLPNLSSQARPPTSSGGSDGSGAGAAATGIGLTGGAVGTGGLGSSGGGTPAGGGTGSVSGIKPGGGGQPGLGSTGSPGGGTTTVAGMPGGGTTTTSPGSAPPPGGPPGPGGNLPGGPGGPDPITVLPPGSPGGNGNPGPGDGDPDPNLGPVPGEGSPDPVNLGGAPGTGEPDPNLGPVPGEGGPDPVNLGPVPGEGSPVPVGSDPGGLGVAPNGSTTGGLTGSGPDGQGGLVGEDIVGENPGDGVVIGPDGMIGSGSGSLGAEGGNGGFAEGEFATGDSGATGFVGADDAVTADGAGGMPVGGAGGKSRDGADRYRDAWMNEEVETWEGGSTAQQVPSQVGV
jgi:uncharacterized protein YukE